MKNSYDFVLDCSLTMAWFLEDESNEYTNSILENFKNLKAIVPTIWPLKFLMFLLNTKK